MAARYPAYNNRASSGGGGGDGDDDEKKDRNRTMSPWLAALLVTLGVIFFALLCLGLWYLFSASAITADAPGSDSSLEYDQVPAYASPIDDIGDQMMGRRQDRQPQQTTQHVTAPARRKIYNTEDMSSSQVAYIISLSQEELIDRIARELHDHPEHEGHITRKYNRVKDYPIDSTQLVDAAHKRLHSSGDIAVE